MKEDRTGYIFLDGDGGARPIFQHEKEVIVLENKEALPGEDGRPQAIRVTDEEVVNSANMVVLHESEVPEILEKLGEVRKLIQKQIDTPSGGWQEKQAPHVHKLLGNSVLRKIANDGFLNSEDGKAAGAESLTSFLGEYNLTEIGQYEKALQDFQMRPSEQE